MQSWVVSGRGAALLPLCLGLTFLVAALTPESAKAEWELGIYGGDAISLDSDINLQQPNGTNLTLNDVPWDSKSFEDPPYYGIRLTYWDELSDWGISFDFTHAKVYSDLGATVSQSGTLNGAGVPGTGSVNNTFSKLEFTDGLNLLTLNAMRRWHWSEHVTPYAGCRDWHRGTAC